MSKTMSRRKKRLVLAVATVLLLTGAGTAFAYWTSTGTGDGSATTGSSELFSIDADPAVGTIAPGGAGQTVDFTVTNPGPGTHMLSGVTVSMASASGVAWVPTGTCDIADYTATVTTAPTYGALAAAGTSDGQVTVTLTNTGVNQDDCQGQTVPLYFQAS